MIEHVKFLWRLTRSVFARETGRPRVPFFMGGAFLVLALPISGFYAASVATAMDLDPEVLTLARLETRLAEAHQLFDRAEAYYEAEVSPIERVLVRYRDDPELVRRIATSLVGEGHRAGVDPNVLLAVLLVENPMLKPDARSSAGAVGLMQIMPGHRGQWSKCGPDLTDVEDNICYGAQIFASYLRENRGDIERALLAYNGCVKSTGCKSYANYVYARAGRASILAALRK